MESSHIRIDFMFSKFTTQQIKTLEFQLALHTQLLTTSVLNTEQKDNMAYIANGSINMLVSGKKKSRLIEIYSDILL